jgi:hypothetical protein
MDDLLEFLQAATVIAAGLVLVFAAVAVPIAFAERAACYNTLEAMDKRGDWKLFGGCFVQVGDTQLPLRAYLERTVPQNIEVK